MQLESYVLHYILDFPELSNRTGKLSLLGAEHGAMMLHQELLRVPAPSVFAQLEHIIVGEEEVMPYTFLECVNERSRILLQLVSLVTHGHERLNYWWQLLEIPAPFRPTLRGALSVISRRMLRVAIRCYSYFWPCA